VFGLPFCAYGKPFSSYVNFIVNRGRRGTLCFLLSGVFTIFFQCRCNASSCGGSAEGFNWVPKSTFYRHAKTQLNNTLRPAANSLGAYVERDGPSERLVDDQRQQQLASPDDDVSVQAAPNRDRNEGRQDHEAPVPRGTDIFLWDIFRSWEEPLIADEMNPPDPVGLSVDHETRRVLLGELLLTYFEWMCVHKPTDESAKAVHGMLSLIIPPNTSNLPEWAELHYLLKVVYEQVAVEVDLCPNDHIAFVDATHPKMLAAGYRHAHRQFCPHPGCGAARYITVDGVKRAAKRGYYYPLDSYLTNLFRDTDTVKFREHSCPLDVQAFPPGHVRHSKGFHDKVIKNPHLQDEGRNQGLIAMADGIPLFRSIKVSKGVNVGAIRQANQPDYISKMFGKIHLSFLYPGEFWVYDDTTKKPKRIKAKPKNLGPMQQLLVDDLLHWYDGKMVTDYSKPVHDPQHHFCLRAILLYWCGDYPGLGEATNFVHEGYNACHWCKIKGNHSAGLSRMVYKDYRRYCDMDDALRQDMRWGSVEERPPPQPRTHAQSVQEGKEADVDPTVRKTTGINGSCPLHLLVKFDVIRDVVPDLMHIIVNFFKHWIPVLAGERAPKRSKTFQKPRPPEPKHHEKNFWSKVRNAYVAKTARRYVH
jgi:hypothetical protein